MGNISIGDTHRSAGVPACTGLSSERVPNRREGETFGTPKGRKVNKQNQIKGSCKSQNPVYFHNLINFCLLFVVRLETGCGIFCTYDILT